MDGPSVRVASQERSARLALPSAEVAPLKSNHLPYPSSSGERAGESAHRRHSSAARSLDTKPRIRQSESIPHQLDSHPPKMRDIPEHASKHQGQRH